METPLQSRRSLGRAVAGTLANYKDWNRGLAFMQLQWSKRPDAGWWVFAEVVAGQLDGTGVFVVWRTGGAVKVSSVLYVGRGSLRDEFARCRRDPLFRADGLYVTWANIHDSRMIDPVGAYLYQHLQPIWGEAVVAPPMPVNLPLTG